ncbi:MAG: UPF0182 family protein [Vicinamibacterales bacterium]
MAVPTGHTSVARAATIMRALPIMSLRRSGTGYRLPLLAIVAAAVLGVPSFAEFYTDWLWYGEVGYQAVYARVLTTRGLAGIAAFLVALPFIVINLRLAFRTVRRREFEILTPDGPRVVAVDPGRLRPILTLGGAAVALLLALYGSAAWDRLLFAWHAVPFGQADPILGRDIGFYVFTLPFLESVQSVLLMLTVVTLLAVAVVHFGAGHVGFDPVNGVFALPVALRQLAVLAACVFAVLAFDAWIGIPQILTTSSGTVHGASYVDVHARIPGQRLLLVVAVLGMLLSLYQATMARLWPIVAAAAVYVLVLVGTNVAAGALQRFVVGPNEQVRETPFIVHNIAATRAGFGLDGVEERGLSGDATLTRADIDRNDATLRNVPLWDHQPLLDTFGQIQEIRTYYDFVSVDNDRYTIDGEYRQIMLSARELNSESLPSRTWINERLTFTHGYGLTLGPVNQVTREGLPVLFIKDLPPASSVDLQVTEPALYFGERSSDHVFVKTGTEEFDYPKGEDNVFTTYKGTGGVELGGMWRRLLFAIRFGSSDTFIAPNLTADSRVLMHRRIAERVEQIAPFLTYDSDPYLAISKGRLLWVQDAYTTSDRFPYSTPAPSGLNYIRNSVKVTIDAYHGTTTFYVVDDRDPIAATLGRMFPTLFRPLAEMPEDLRTRMRYPRGIFALQASMFSTFHMTNPAVFYNKEDQWEIPSVDGAGQAARMEPYYTIMKLPGQPGAEYIQILPFTPRQKDNLSAWMVARSDGEHYGKLMVFQFPKQTVVFGPRQVAARINQDQAISPQITLWNQQGSEVIWGTLLVIPVEESLLYIRPLYLRAAGGRIPELKRVIVAYQNDIVMEETLEQGLERLFPRGAGGAGVRPSSAGPLQTAGELAASAAAADAPRLASDALLVAAREHYRLAMEAQRSGDWARYGDEIKKLGDVLDQLSKR